MPDTPAENAAAAPAEIVANWTAADGTCFGCRRWWPAAAAGPPRARVVALHGMSCHAADFAPLGEVFSAHGIALEAWNLRGQGLDPTTTRRGAWLEVAGMLADLEAFVGPEEAAGPPLYLCGESMGALLAIQAAAREPWRGRIAGLLLFVPVVALARRNPPWMKPALRALSVVAPGLRLRPSWFVEGKATMPALTRIPERQRALETAPHRLRAPTVGFLAAMGDLIETGMRAAPRLERPTAVFTTGRDVFITTAQSRAFFDGIAARDKAWFHYPESYHQALFDLDADEVVADALAWMQARLPDRVRPGAEVLPRPPDAANP